jgi:hypothetical protein
MDRKGLGPNIILQSAELQMARRRMSAGNISTSPIRTVGYFEKELTKMFEPTGDVAPALLSGAESESGSEERAKR